MPTDAHAPIRPAIPPMAVRLLSVDDYRKMVGSGLFPWIERTELLEGWIVLKMTKNPPHEVACALVQQAIGLILPDAFHGRGQSAITLDGSEPEPDFAVVRGGIRDYLGRHPGPGEVLIVVEVSESSLHDDRKIKGRIYARSGIPQYWLVNLVDQIIEVRTDPTGPTARPRYRHQTDYGAGGLIPLLLDGLNPAQGIAVDDLLP